MPIVQKQGHQTGEAIDSPAYIDANFLVYYSIGSERVPTFQAMARNVMGDLLAQRVTILVSLTTVEEAWWSTLQELYCRHIWRSPFPNAQCRFNRDIAVRNFRLLMQHRSDLEKIIGGLQDLRQNGADIRFVPEASESFDVCQSVPNHMNKYTLLSADALHLTLSFTQAATFITFDHDFSGVLDPNKDLTVILLS